MAPGVPSRLRTGVSVAWLSEGSCTDQVASASDISAASAISAMPPHSHSLRRIALRMSSDQSQASRVVRSVAVVMCESSWVRCHRSVSNHGSAQHGDDAMQRLGRGLLVLNECDADVAVAGIAAVGAVARRDSCRE